ncbi:MAG TPA: DUF4349 domain-containing protein [Solirubrobacterales bacterium]
MFDSDAELTATLRALRPTPAPAFAAELDERAAAGFPAAAGSARGRFASFLERLRTTQPRRILVPAGALALGAIVVATTVVTISGSDDGSGPNPSLTTSSKPAQETSGGSSLSEKPVPVAPSAATDSPTGRAAGDSAMPQSSGSTATEYKDPLSQATATTDASKTGPFASGRDQRAIERSASIVLGTDPEGLRDAAAGVFDAVHAADGIVLSSSVDGGPNGGSASFELLIPSAQLGDALASISSVAEVRSRHEATGDITAPTIGVGERLQDTNATVRGLLDQLAAADTDAERVAAEAELREARARAAALRSRLSSLERRANLSHLSVRIETGGDSGSGTGSGGAWGVDDGIDGAGRVLAVAAGVTVIGLAALAPLALLALLAWLAHLAWLRHARRHALARS